MIEPQTFESWKYLVDPEANRLAYSQIDHGSAADCVCDDCVYWNENRLRFLPKKVLDWFELVGIDAAKEAEVSEFQGEPDNKMFMGNYWLIGELESGPDAYQPHADGNGASFTPTSIAPGFKFGISFCAKFGPPVPESLADKSPLMQVLFEVSITNP